MPTPSAHDALAQALADRYTVVRELGSGGMATVWLARDLRHDRDVAIKVLHPDLGAALGGERFLTEIRTTARLQHPHILPLLDSGDGGNGLLYYVMPYVRGETLRARLERERQLPVADAVRLAKEVAGALEHAHRQGVVHRDIKPENILLQEGSALVADFGIALAVQQAGGPRLTQTGLSLGTPQYMSPEQAMGERTIDARSDVYALGAVAYEMLAGEPPFTGPTIQAIVARLMSEEPRALIAQRKAIPEAVEAAVLRALEKLPADRFASAAEFAVALEAPTTTATRLTRAQPSARGPRGLAAALGVVALVASGAAAWGWMRPVATPAVVRYRIFVDSVPAVKDWAGEVAISPDGATIVRSGGPGGNLLVRRRDQLTFTPIGGTEGASAPFFAPDGEHVGYFANDALHSVPIGGGPTTLLLDSISAPTSVTWGTDDRLYLSPAMAGGTVIASAPARAGAKLEALTRLDTASGEESHLHPSPIPGGKKLLLSVSYRNGQRRIAVGDIATGHITPLIDGVRARYVPGGWLLFTTSEARLFVVPFDAEKGAITGDPVQVAERLPDSVIGAVDFDISANGTLVYSEEIAGEQRELVWVSRTGARTLFDSTWRGVFRTPTLSRDGRRLAVAMARERQFDIWLRDVAGGEPVRLTNEPRQSSAEPAWSRDGTWVSYLVSRNGNTGDVWRRRVDGTGREELVLKATRPFSEQEWSPVEDRLFLRTTTPAAGAGDILTIRPGQESLPTPVAASPKNEYSPAISPDGRWLAFTGSYTGRLEIYVVPLAHPDSARWMISTKGGSAPRWSHKGDELFYLDQRSNLVSARISTSPTFTVLGTRILFNTNDYIQTSTSRRNYDVAPDDQRFLFIQRAGGDRNGQMVVVENWVQELERGRRK